MRRVSAVVRRRRLPTHVAGRPPHLPRCPSLGAALSFSFFVASSCPFPVRILFVSWRFDGHFSCCACATASFTQPLEAGSLDMDLLCLSCGATTTPMWRSGPEGPRTLCNACGLRRRNHPFATREGCASSGATVQQSGKHGRDSSTYSSSSLCRLSKVRGSSLASRAAAADAAKSREEQSAAPPSVGVELLSSIALSRGRRFFSAGRGARDSPLPQSSPTGALVRPGASIGANGTGSSRARSTTSSAFRRLVDGSRNLPKALPSAYLEHEGVGGHCLVSGRALPHTSLPSSVAKDGMHAVPAASGSTASRGLSWTAADAVVPAKVKQEPEPAAVIKQEELAVDKGRRRAVAIALRHTLYPPDGVDKAAIVRVAYRTTAFARRTKPRATSGEPSACGAVVAVAAAEPGADSSTAVVSGSRTMPTGDAEIAAAAATRLVAAKVSGKAPADRQGDAGAGDARDGVGGVIHVAGGGFDGADEARAATVGAAGAVADEATGRRRGERDGGHGSPRRSGDAHKDPSGDAQKDK